MNSYRRFRKGYHLLSGAAAHRSRVRRNKASRHRRSWWAKMANVKGQREIMQYCTWGFFVFFFFNSVRRFAAGKRLCNGKGQAFFLKRITCTAREEKNKKQTNKQTSKQPCWFAWGLNKSRLFSFGARSRGVTLTCWLLTPPNGKTHRHSHGRATPRPLLLYLRESQLHKNLLLQQLVDSAEQEGVVSVALKRKNERRVSPLSYVKALRACIENSNAADFLLHQVFDLRLGTSCCERARRGSGCPTTLVVT